MIIGGCLLLWRAAQAETENVLLRSRQIGAQRSHQFDEAREARSDEATIVDTHRMLAGEAEDERGHGDAVVHMRLDQTTAGNLAAALHNQVIAFDLGSHAVASQQSR